MSSRAPAFAIAAASVSVVTSLIAVGVVAGRTGTKPGEQLTVSATVAASNVIQLKRDAVEPVGDGVGVRDDKLRDQLGLQAGDVLVMLNGRALKRERDVSEAILAASMFEAQMIDVDVVRDGKPLLLRWKLDGDLRSARRIDTTSRPPAATITPSVDPIDPFGSPYGGSLTSRDPLLDTITKIDETHYQIPRSTVDRILANPVDFVKGARVVPAMKAGRPDGLKLYAIRPNSVYGALGVMNGDTLRSVNGFELDTLDKMLEIYTKVKDAGALEIEVDRRGRPVTISIEIK